MNTEDSCLFHTFAEVIDEFNVVLNVSIVLIIYEVDFFVTSSYAQIQKIPTVSHDDLCAQLQWVRAADHITAWFTSHALRTCPTLIKLIILRFS